MRILILTQMLVSAWYEYLERCFFLSKPRSCFGVKKYEPMILVVFHRNPYVMVYHFIPTSRWVFHHPLKTLNNQGPFKPFYLLIIKVPSSTICLPFCRIFFGAGSGHPKIHRFFSGKGKAWQKSVRIPPTSCWLPNRKLRQIHVVMVVLMQLQELNPQKKCVWTSLKTGLWSGFANPRSIVRGRVAKPRRDQTKGP